MAIDEDILERNPRYARRSNDDSSLYRKSDGKVFFHDYLVRGADLETFRFFLGGFAKDRKNCYCTNSRLTGGNAEAFRALNFCYATDGQFVWTIGGKVKGADARSFAVCDEGFRRLFSGSRVPRGYGKDSRAVFYYDNQGKPKLVRKASASSFRSLNDGTFGVDDNFVFCGAAVIPKAVAGQWHIVGGNYSMDNSRVFYFAREMREADLGTFEVLSSTHTQLARDKDHFFWNDHLVDEGEFEQLLSDENA